MAQIEIRESSAVPSVVHAGAAVLLGLVALPLLLSGQQVGGRVEEIAWLVAGLLIGIWLLVIAPSLARDLAALLIRLGLGRGAAGRRATHAEAGVTGVAQWLVALGYVLLVQAILRRPLVLALSATFDSVTVEAIFAAVVLMLLIVVLLRLHWAARPLIELATWSVLDALVATSGSEQSASAQAFGTAMEAEVTRAAGPGATRGEPPQVTVPADRASLTEAPTVFARTSDVTLAATHPAVPDKASGDAAIQATDGDATVAELATAFAGEKPAESTLVADADEHLNAGTNPTSSAEATLTLPRQDETSAIVPADTTGVDSTNDETIATSVSDGSSASPSANDVTVIASAEETKADAREPHRQGERR